MYREAYDQNMSPQTRDRYRDNPIGYIPTPMYTHSLTARFLPMAVYLREGRGSSGDEPEGHEGGQPDEEQGRRDEQRDHRDGR